MWSAGQGRGMEQLRGGLHPTTPGRFWGPLLVAVLRVPVGSQVAQLPIRLIATNEIPLKAFVRLFLFCFVRLFVCRS